MEINEIGINAIKSFEALRLKAYKCPAGVWTIGYGHTRGVKPGMVITKKQAETLLRGDLLPVEKYVNSLRRIFTQGEFNAVVDFIFNLGQAKFAKSTLCRKIMAHSPDDEVCKEFKRWVHGGGKTLLGLVERRQWDCRQWIAGK